MGDEKNIAITIEIDGIVIKITAEDIKAAIEFIRKLFENFARK